MVKDIPGYEGLYQITDDAKVISLHTGRPVSPWISNKGYQCVSLYKNGSSKHFLVHRLYAEAYIPNPNNFPIVLHLDNNKLNLDKSNLIWGTYSQNNSQAIRDGLNKIPVPDNRKYYSIGDPHSCIIGSFLGIKEIIHSDEENLTESILRNCMFRHTPIPRGKYKGYYVGKSVIII